MNYIITEYILYIMDFVVCFFKLRNTSWASFYIVYIFSWQTFAFPLLFLSFASFLAATFFFFLAITNIISVNILVENS